MSNRIEHKFRELKRARRKAFIAFVTAGDPSLAKTREIVLALEQSGADIIELGVPFSDPLADGPTIQASSERALKHGVNLEKIIALVKSLRRQTQIPIALMTYYNPVYHYGTDRFIAAAKSAGVDGVIIPDLPPEEDSGFTRAAKRAGLSTIFFLSPTTRPHRMKTVIKASSGFIYFVSLRGVTGARKELPSDVLAKIRQAKRLTDKPVCVGFGISTPQHVKDFSKYCDGVIVGSAIVRQIEKYSGRPELARRVGHFVKTLVEALNPK